MLKQAEGMEPKDKTEHIKKARGKLKQAIYCLNRAIKLEPNVDELLWDKAVLLQVKSRVKLSLEKHR